MLFWLYNILFVPLAALYLLWFAVSNRRGLLKRLPQELGERLALYPEELTRRLSRRPVIWFHAASLGEVKALRFLIARVKAGCPGHSLILTASNSVARAQADAIVEIDAALLAPLDFYPVARRAVRLLRPKALIVAETELWPSLVRAAHAAGARLAVVNARLSARSFRRYAWVRPLIQETLAPLDLVCAQSGEDAARFLALGARAQRTVSVGNLKYDQFFDQAPDLAPLAARLRSAGWNPSDPVFVAGSTHAGEEEAALRAFAAAKARDPSARMILAPRHLERLAEVSAAVERAGLSCALWSRPEGAADLLLLDAVGILPGVYGLARVAFVGGTLAPRGGHNLLEPVRFSVPVLFGPHVDNIREVAEVLRRSGGGLQVEDAEVLAAAVADLLPDAARCRDLGRTGREAAESLRGATERTLAKLLPLL